MMDSEKRADISSWVSPSSASETESGVRFKTSGWEEGVHWNGSLYIELSNPFFRFWHWVFENRKVLPPLLDMARCESIAARWDELAWPPLLDPPSGGLYLLFNPEPENTIKTTRFWQRLNEAGYGRVVREIMSNDETPFWAAMRLLSANSVFLFNHGECVASTQLSKSVTVEDLIFSNLLSDLKEVYRQAR